jgi:hypothetical protein
LRALFARVNSRSTTGANMLFGVDCLP